MYRHRRTGYKLAILLVVGVTALAAEPAEAKKKKKKGKKASMTKITAGGPTLKYEQFRRKIEFKVAEKREEQIQGIKRLVDLGPDKNELPDLKFRLAELYFEKSRFYFFRAQETDDRLIRSKDPSEKDRLEDEKKRNLQEAKIWAESAADIYREIRDRYPKYERMPEVLFALGQSYWNQGRFPQAIEVYRELIVNFRDSPLVAEAWIAFGEYYFGEGDVNRALKSYQKAATDRKSRVYGFALYKQAWCYYNLSEWKEALRKFKATVIYSQLAEELSGENKIALGREATKDYVRTYAHVGNEKRAKHQFADLLGTDDCAGDRCRKLLEQLANLWFDAGYFIDSAGIYRQLIQLKPGNSRNPLYQAKIVDLKSRDASKKAVIRSTRRLVEVTEETEKKLGPNPGEQAKEDLAEARTMAETTMRRLAQIWNREAKKTRNEKTYGYARTMYEDYLKLYPGTKYAYEMNFQLGDLYYKLEKFDDAAKQYEKTVLADPKGKYLADAANDNILAVEEHIKDLGVRPPKKVKTAKTIHPQKVRLIEACDRFVKFAPDDGKTGKKKTAVRFKAAKTYYNWGHNDEAMKRMHSIVLEHPKADQAEFSANLVIDIYNQREDWKSLYERSVEYLKLEGLADGRPALAKELSQYAEYASFKLVQILEERVKKERGDLRLVAQGYQDFYEQFPKSENADKALFNASVSWDKAGKKENADELRRKLLKEYPKSPLRADVAYYIAKQSEERTEFKVAAKSFLDFARKHEDDPRARDALYNAAVFYAGVGSVKTATKLREEYLKKYGRAKKAQKEAADIYWSIAQDLERGGRYRDAATRYRDYAKEFSNTDRFWDALWNEAELRQTKLRQRSKAERIKRDILGTYQYRKKRKKKLPDNAKLYASQVAFERLEDYWTKYRKLRVRTPNLRNPKPFQRSLADKAKERDRVIKRYTSIVTEYQQAESTIASLYRIAQAWDEFVVTLGKVPCPRGVAADVCSLIKQGIEEKAGPAREGAYQAYKTCVAKSNELNVFTKYSTRCVKALETLAPDAYPQITERALDFSGQRPLKAVRPNDLILRYDGYEVVREVQANAKAEVTP